MAAMVTIVAQLNRDAKQMQIVVDCFDKCGFALTLDVSDESLGENEEVWMSQLPNFKAWIASLSEKSLYRHLLESLNHSSGAMEGESIIDDLTEADMELELGQIDGIDGHDAHLADALAGLSDDEFQ